MKSPLLHFIAAAALLILAGAAYIGWYNTVSNKSRQVADVQQKIDEANKNLNRIASARAALAEIADDEATVRSYFVPEANVVAFITDLEQLGVKQGAEVNVLSVSTAGSAAQSTLLLSLSITGAFDSVMRTVGAMEYAPYNLSVKELSIALDEKKLWRADVSIAVGSAPNATTTNRTR